MSTDARLDDQRRQDQHEERREERDEPHEALSEATTVAVVAEGDQMSGVKNVYVWDYVSGLTTHWHDGGGLLILAADMDRAKELFQIEASKEHTYLLRFPEDAPTSSWEVSDNEEDAIFVFPDSGCC